MKGPLVMRFKILCRFQSTAAPAHHGRIRSARLQAKVHVQQLRRLRPPPQLVQHQPLVPHLVRAARHRRPADGGSQR